MTAGQVPYPVPRESASAAVQVRTRIREDNRRWLKVGQVRLESPLDQKIRRDVPILGSLVESLMECLGQPNLHSRPFFLVDPWPCHDGSLLVECAKVVDSGSTNGLFAHQAVMHLQVQPVIQPGPYNYPSHGSRTIEHMFAIEGA